MPGCVSFIGSTEMSVMLEVFLIFFSHNKEALVMEKALRCTLIGEFRYS